MARLRSVLLPLPVTGAVGTALVSLELPQPITATGKGSLHESFPMHWPHTPGAFGVCREPILPGKSQQQPRGARNSREPARRERESLAILSPFLGIASPEKSAPESALNNCVCRGMGSQLFISSFLHLPSVPGPGGSGFLRTRVHKQGRFYFAPLT